MSARSVTAGAVSVALAVLLAFASAISSGTYAVMFAAGAGMLPMAWVFGSDTRSRSVNQTPQSQIVLIDMHDAADQRSSAGPAIIWLPVPPPVTGVSPRASGGIP